MYFSNVTLLSLFQTQTLTLVTSPLPSSASHESRSHRLAAPPTIDHSSLLGYHQGTDCTGTSGVRNHTAVSPLLLLRL
ncbi:hypothetical protein RND81_12G037900 [Saponaria officinalis]|uniref:Secreted protein n=1 Tax=Saponaria officinalis TaxID=3572 RepID=A0AAW1H782_SAPOF